MKVSEQISILQGWKGRLSILERQIILFPLLVVLLACISLLLGGRCSVWQWWTAVILVVAVPFVKKANWKYALASASLFAFFLFALRCLIPPLVWDDIACPDMAAYHLPMIQLLIEGWNPVWDPMAEGVAKSLGLDLWGMAPLHVAFLPKTMAVFSAVSYGFIRDPLALAFSGPFVLWCGVFMTSIRKFNGMPRVMLLVALVGALPMVAWHMPLDLCLAFASCGLLLTMHDSLKRKSCDWISLTVWCLWMMNLKLNGLMAAFIFCVLFVVATLWKERANWKWRFGRFAAWGLLLLLLSGIISWNPLGTSWRSYGHPLYPFKTIDASQFPVLDLTWDLRGGNEDYLEMGRIGLFSHAYLGPKATIAFYRRVLRRDLFNPACTWWKWDEFPSDSARLAISLCMLILLILPGGRIWALGGMLLLIIVPRHMIGFTRYQPWLSSLGCLAVLLAAEWACVRLSVQLVRFLSISAATLLCFLVVTQSIQIAQRIECKAHELSVPRERVGSPFWRGPIDFRKKLAACVEGFYPRYNYLTCRENRTRLLIRELGMEGQTKVIPANDLVQLLGLELDWDERDWIQKSPSKKMSAKTVLPRPTLEEKPSEIEAHWFQTPFGYYVPWGDHTDHFVEYCAWTQPVADNGPWKKPGWKAKALFSAWFVTYPKEIWKRLKPRKSS